MSSLRERDRAVLWHPATHFGDLDRAPAIPIVAAHGVWLTDDQGREILDGIGSWWTSVHGHAHPHVVAAIARQAATLDHVMFAGFTHAPAVELAERLLLAAPRGGEQDPVYGKVFFSDCGSGTSDIACSSGNSSTASGKVRWSWSCSPARTVSSCGVVR